MYVKQGLPSEMAAKSQAVVCVPFYDDGQDSD